MVGRSSRERPTSPWPARSTRDTSAPDVVYLDNAATSFPKPPAVAESIVDFLEHSAGNPGRSGHALAIAAQTAVCLLYTSDAADDLTRVDLGGRRIIKKK